MRLPSPRYIRFFKFIPLILLVALGCVLCSSTGNAQGINFPVGQPTGTSGTGNGRTDPDNLFFRNNIAGLTEIALDAAEEASGRPGKGTKGAWRAFGEFQLARYHYTRTRPVTGLGTVESDATLYAPGLSGELTYTSADHRYGFGIATYQIFGFESKMVDPATLGPRRLFFDTRIASNDLAFGGALRLHEKLSVGASFVFGRAFLDLHAPALELLPRGIVQDVRLDVARVGAPGATLGLHYRPTGKIGIGFNYKSRRTYNLEGRFDTVQPQVTAGGLQLIPIRPDVKVRFELPDIIETGIEVKPTEQLILVGDYRFYRYSSSLGTVNVRARANDQVLTSVRVDADDVHSVRLGTVYKVSDATKLNFGFAFTSNGVPEQNLNPGLINTGGVDISGAIHKRIFGQWVNFGVAGVFARKRTISPSVNPFPGDYKGTGVLFGFGIRLRN